MRSQNGGCVAHVGADVDDGSARILGGHELRHDADAKVTVRLEGNQPRQRMAVRQVEADSLKIDPARSLPLESGFLVFCPNRPKSLKGAGGEDPFDELFEHRY